MNINSINKKAFIKNVHKMTKEEISLIARDVAIKLCLAFPNQDLNRKDLFDSFSCIDMYTANLSMDSSGAKYFSDINAICFNSELDFEQLPEVAMHECIHFLQMRNSKNQMKAYNFSSGLAINEAAVQLMASEANMCSVSEEKLFGINLKTNSPNYYPLECAILKQMSYFTGDYALYSSTLENTNTFKNAFISKFSKKVYNFIVRKLDKLLNLENDLQYYINELSQATSARHIANLNDVISAQKKDISDLFFRIQNYIIKNCFCFQYNNIRSNEDLYNFKNQLYNFKNVIGYTENYSFYNDFYCDMMNALESRKEQIACYGDLNLPVQTQALMIVDKKEPSFVFLHTAIKKLKKLIGISIPEGNL